MNYRYKYLINHSEIGVMWTPTSRFHSSLGHHLVATSTTSQRFWWEGILQIFSGDRCRRRTAVLLANSSGSENFRSLNMMCKQMAIFYRGNDHEPSDLFKFWGYQIFTNPMESFSHGQEWHFHTFSKPCFFLVPIFNAKSRRLRCRPLCNDGDEQLLE